VSGLGRDFYKQSVADIFGGEWDADEQELLVDLLSDDDEHDDDEEDDDGY
jgi:hypothetical protein